MAKHLIIALLLALTYGCQSQQSQTSDEQNINHSPTVDAGPDQTVNEQTLISLSGSGDDADGEAISFTWSQISGPNVVLNSTSAASTSFTSPAVATSTELMFRLTVTDNHNNTSYDDVVITVLDQTTSNIPPTANAGPDQIINEQSAATLNGSGEDTDGVITSYSWSQISGPNIILENSNTANAAFTSPAVDSSTVLIFRLTVTDSGNSTASDDVQITVLPQYTNTPPTANNDSYSTYQDQPLIINAPGILTNDSDPEFDSLAAILVTEPANGTLILNTDGAITYTPNTGFSGQDSFSYKANDGTDDSATATVTIEIVQMSSNWNADDFTNVYDIGPGQSYTTPEDFPWETLAPDSLVRIHWRAEPYRNKWAINTAATADQPVVILGIPNGDLLPVISGDNATTRLQLSYWNEQRSIIKIGGSNLPANPTASYIYIENLDIQSARPEFSFTASNGNLNTYSSNAAAIHIESGTHITIRGCSLHDVGNGLFAGSSSSDIVVSGNHIYDNGEVGTGFNHNSYTEVRNITFEYNYFGPLRSGAGGENIKDRSSGTIIRYNWIESGNRQLDLVETDYDFIATDPSYSNTYVYGNVLIERAGDGNGNMIHYGGDGGYLSRYRNGTLHFYHNTVITSRSDQTGLFGISINSARVDARNNIFYATNGGNSLGISTGNGQFELHNNWLSQNWRSSLDTFLGSITEDNNVTGTDPGFVDFGSEDFHLATGSTAIDIGGTLSPSAADYPVIKQYVKHLQSEIRSADPSPDAGAYDFAQ